LIATADVASAAPPIAGSRRYVEVMARPEQRHPGNVAGDWYVDERCIDCDTCRETAPEVFVRTGMQSVVGRQPTDAVQHHRAWLAAVACPTQSIGQVPRHPKPAGLFPDRIDGDVYALGWTSPDSYGADSYLVVRPDGNLMVDAPRFTRFLAEPIEALGGVAHILLSHRDDVADAQRYAERFDARVWIHTDDRQAAPFATDHIVGLDPVTIAPGVAIIPTPGHTKGSMVFEVDRTYLFTGDSLSWNRHDDDLEAFRDVCWWSWPQQTRSLERLASVARFEWVLPGHGGRGHRPADEMHDRLVALVGRMLVDA
jgi:glyoxylase-like metal-dependent hydrolase (beta-lactamase superfamily II)